MRIGIMLRHIQEKGGIVTYSHNLLKGFFRQKSGHHFALLYASPDMLGTYASSPGVSEHVIPRSSKFVWDHWSVPRFADKLELDLIFNPKLSVPLWARQKRVLVLRPEQFVHPELFPWTDRRYFKFFIPKYCKVSARVIAPAEISTRDIINHVGVEPAKVVTVHEGCGDHFFTATPSAPAEARVREKYNLPPDYVLFVGGLTPLKNFERLIQAYAKVQARHGIPLVVVGFNRWRFEKDLSFVSHHPASQHILFPGFVDDQDLPYVYRMATVLFFPSIYEGFGIPIPEAFATGCPVVTTTRGACPEVAGGAAVLVDPFDVDDMARGLESVVSSASVQEELRAKGLARAPYFGYDRVASQTLEVLEQAMNGI
ncbi:MAG: glycosyltransferase family 1 protein [Desulfarculaceae bacterium]|jgi:glycosyltransferase involved in cell wall biosynthesis